MKTVNEVSKLTGVSIRTLQYYDKIGLLKPAEYTESGYRLYDDAVLERLQQILLFRELEFPLKDIKDIVTRSDFDKRLALDQQIELLELKKEHIENLISMCRGLKLRGVKHLDFTAFDSSKLDEYAKRAKERWGNTPEYKEFEEKNGKRSKSEEKSMIQSVRFLTTAVASEMSYSAGLQRQALFSIALVLFLFIMLINATLNFFLKHEKA